MGFVARVVEVMIASPGDVAEERRVIREVLNEWNAVHARDRELVALPVGWETHSWPQLGGRAQELINKQVLHGCDLLVGVFWTRLGSPTGEAASGTVEEIEKHVAAGKPAMLYFSNAPVHPERIDYTQYTALSKFRDDYKTRGLLEFYNSVDEFRDKFARQFAQTMLSAFDLDERSARDSPPEEPTPIQLRAEAQRLLLDAAKDPGGVFAILRTGLGPIFQVGDNVLYQGSNAREVARWEAAVEQLVKNGLVTDPGENGELFYLTDEGFHLAESLAPPAT